MKKLSDIKYFSKDKMYSIKNDVIKNHPKVLCLLLFAISCLFLLISGYSFSKSFNFNQTVEKASYNIKGASDYTVYLKDNDYYESKFLNSGMKYVASLISTVNTSFNYEIHSTKNLDFDYTYKIVGNLKVTDKDNTSKVLYSKMYDLSEEKSDSINANNLVINENVDIDYNLYNQYVRNYLSQYGLDANAELQVSLVVNINGEYDNSNQQIANGSVMIIDIPLSEQTIDIGIQNSSIDLNEKFFDDTSYTVSNIGLFLLSAISLIISLLLVIITTRLSKKYVRDNIYTVTLNRILKEYDRIIVNGTFTINEEKFLHKIYVDKFTELVDASQTFNEPILFYNVIPGEKCFFVIIKDDTLYKMRLTKAYLENEKYNTDNKDSDSEKVEYKEEKIEETKTEDVKTASEIPKKKRKNK